MMEQTNTNAAGRYIYGGIVNRKDTEAQKLWFNFLVITHQIED